MKVSVGQFAAGEDKDRNLDTIDTLAREAAAEGAQLLVLPEFSMYRQVVRDAATLRAAESLDGPFVQRICSISRGRRLAIIVGMSEAGREPAGRMYNTLALVSASGELQGAYRKLHLYDAFGGQESRWVRPGEHGQRAVYEIGGLKFGLMTCYDLRFPEQSRALMDAGAEVIVLPAAWTPGIRKDDHWNVLTRARAIENTAYLVAADQAPPQCPGGSRIIDPMGVVLAEAGERQQIICATLDPQRLAQVRATNPTLRHRRFTVVPRLACSSYVIEKDQHGVAFHVQN
jgi:deaminated glutathione amidase